MTSSGKLSITTKGDREIVMTRVFDAPRQMVFDANTKPELIRRWLLGPPGWTMTVCEVDLRVGGKYRYEWRNEKGVEMGMGGVIREITPPERYVCTEKFDESWYPGEAIDTLVLTEKNGKTTLTLTMTFESKEARDGVAKSGMASGVEVSYARLDEILAETA